MHAFDFILVLFSFVCAAAMTHLISTEGESIIASRAHQALVVQCGLDVSPAAARSACPPWHANALKARPLLHPRYGGVHVCAVQVRRA